MSEYCPVEPDLRSVLESEARLIACVAELEAERDRLHELLACAYQLAGTVGAPVRFLDAFSRHEGSIDDLLPVAYDEIESCARVAELKDRLRQASCAIPCTCGYVRHGVGVGSPCLHCELAGAALAGMDERNAVQPGRIMSEQEAAESIERLRGLKTTRKALTGRGSDEQV